MGRIWVCFDAGGKASGVDLILDFARIPTLYVLRGLVTYGCADVGFRFDM